MVKYLSVVSANEELEKAELVNEIEGLESKKSSIKSLLAELKFHLYGKFGKKINLEENEEE